MTILMIALGCYGIVLAGKIVRHRRHKAWEAAQWTAEPGKTK